MIQLKKILKIDLYGGYILNIIVTNNIIKSISKYSNKINYTDNIDPIIDGIHACHNNKSYKSYLFITPNGTLSTVSHEAFHATLKIMEYIGAELNEGSEESYAYLLGYIIDNILQTINKYNK